MGCLCKNKNEIKINSYPYEKIREYNSLKPELNRITLDTDDINRKNENKLLELINKTSNIMNELERAVNDNKQSNENSNNNMFKGLEKDIIEIRQYNYMLNTLLKENKENKNKEYDLGFDNINNYYLNSDLNKSKKNEKKINHKKFMELKD